MDKYWFKYWQLICGDWRPFVAYSYSLLIALNSLRFGNLIEIINILCDLCVSLRFFAHFALFWTGLLRINSGFRHFVQ